MLKAFDYIEYSEDSLRTQQKEAFAKELTIAHNQTASCFTGGQKPARCVCGAKPVFFFSKWGVDYYRCDSCATVLAGALPEEVSAYQASPDLIEYRLNAQYQKEAADHRDLNWEELIEWVRFRTFRYLNLTRVDIADFGNRYEGLCQKIMDSDFCKSYRLHHSILPEANFCKGDQAPAEVALYVDNLQKATDPLSELKMVQDGMARDGLLFLGTRIGTGFDILTLKEHAKIYPYEHVFLPSLQALEQLLAQAGFRVLDISTPGRLDSIYVAKNQDKLDPRDYFIRFLMRQGDKSILQEFQRFLQKSGLSSYAQIVAQKEVNGIWNV